MGKKTHSAVYLSIYFSTVILLAVSITLLILGENASRTRLLTQEEDGLLSLALFFHPSWLLWGENLSLLELKCSIMRQAPIYQMSDDGTKRPRWPTFLFLMWFRDQFKPLKLFQTHKIKGNKIQNSWWIMDHVFLNIQRCRVVAEMHWYLTPCYLRPILGALWLSRILKITL